MSSTERGRRAKERKRSRIVVDVDDAGRGGRGNPDRTARTPRGGRRGSKRGRRRVALGTFVVSLVVIVAALAGAYVWYQSYQKSPAYSLALLVDAAGRNDRQAVDQLVDIDQVTQSLVPQVVAKISGRAQTPQNAQVPAAVRRYVEANAGVLIPGAREAVRAALIQQVKSGVASRADGYPFFVTALGARLAADEIKVDGDVGRVTFKSNNQPVVLTMQRSGAGERWRVVSVQSDELAQRIADNLSRGLPALGR
ncbi:MAG: DUF2939 domain-containing protein [Pyrinomonadaceae bacterium]